MTNIDEVVEGRLSKIVEEVCDFDFEGKLFTDIGFEEFKTHIKQALQTVERETREEERAFILNILDGIDIADEEMQNKGGGTKAIRLALESRIIQSP